MANPIIQMLGKNNPINTANQIINSMNGKNPDALFQQMMNTNPQFRQFVEANKGKTPSQIARENGLDPSVLNKLR